MHMNKRRGENLCIGNWHASCSCWYSFQRLESQQIRTSTPRRTSGPKEGRTEVISVERNNAAATIGRLADCTISIPDDRDASRRHARLHSRDGGWWLEDLGSANGTFIGEFARSRKIAAAVKLLPGQIFRVGLTRFRLEEEDYEGDKLKMVNRLAAGVA